MTDMLEYSKSQKTKPMSQDEYKPMNVIPMIKNLFATTSYLAGPSQFGYQLRSNMGIFGKIALADPFDACGSSLKQKNLHDTILVAKRGNCIFIEKTRLAEKAGALGLIISQYYCYSLAKKLFKVINLTLF